MAVLIASGSERRLDLEGTLQAYAPIDPTLGAFKIFPPMPAPLAKRDYRYWVQSNDGALALPANIKRKPKAAVVRTDRSMTKVEGTIDEYAQEELIDPSDTADSATIEDREMAAVNTNHGIILRKLEQDVATACFNTTTLPISGTTGFSAAVSWATVASSTPMVDVLKAKRYGKANSGADLNCMALRLVDYYNLCMSASFSARNYNVSGMRNNAIIPPDQLAAMLGLEEIIIVDAKYNSANANLTAVVSDVWGSTAYALVFRKERTSNYQVPQWGRMFWCDVDLAEGGDRVQVDSKKVDDVLGASILVEQYTEPGKRSYVIGSRMFASPVVLNSGAACLIQL